jgi:hypothetical protein
MAEEMRELFGEVISSYPGAAAIEDGILIPFVVNGRDTHHRITGNAFDRLAQFYRQNGYPTYSEVDFYRFFFAELLPLVPEAVRVYEQNIRGGILVADYRFKMTQASDGERLWLAVVCSERDFRNFDFAP